MFKFDYNLLRVEKMYVKAVTEALGGSMQVVDTEPYLNDGTITTQRVSIPYAIARAFKKRNRGKSNFFVPVEVAVVYYDDMVVCVEKRNEYAVVEDNVWMPNVDYSRRRKLPDLLRKYDHWYTDGTMVYAIQDDAYDSSKHEPLTENGKMYAVSVQAFRFSDMTDLALVDKTHTRSVAALQVNGEIVFTPPIWTNVLDIRGNSNIRSGQQADGERKYRFTEIDKEYLVNLEFVLNAAKTIGNMFGFDRIVYLQLERHMINLNTVNLPKVNKSVRSTYDTGLTYLHCFAWCMGFLNKCQTLEQYQSVRGLIKVLCKNSLFSRTFRKKLDQVPPPAEKTKDEAMSDITAKYSDYQLSTYWMNKGDVSKIGTNGEQFLTGNLD